MSVQKVERSGSVKGAWRVFKELEVRLADKALIGSVTQQAARDCGCHYKVSSRAGACSKWKS